MSFFCAHETHVYYGCMTNSNGSEDEHKTEYTKMVHEVIVREATAKAEAEKAWLLEIAKESKDVLNENSGNQNAPSKNDDARTTPPSH